MALIRRYFGKKAIFWFQQRYAEYRVTMVMVRGWGVTGHGQDNVGWYFKQAKGDTHQGTGWGDSRINGK